MHAGSRQRRPTIDRGRLGGPRSHAGEYGARLPNSGGCDVLAAAPTVALGSVRVLILDSDIFLIDRRYTRAARYGANRGFLEELFSRGIARATTVFNLLEVCG